MENNLIQWDWTYWLNNYEKRGNCIKHLKIENKADHAKEKGNMIDFYKNKKYINLLGTC